MSNPSTGALARQAGLLPLWARPDIIPAELRERPQWVVWRIVKRDGSPTKEPYQAANPKARAKTNDPSTWAAWEIAVAAASAPENKLDGIGFVFSADDPYAGIDFDNCLNDGELMPWAIDYIKAMQEAYGETSPSGRGIKLFVQAELPNGKGKNKRGLGDDGTGGIEVYDRGRFFTVTGNRICGNGEIADYNEIVQALHASLGVKPPRSTERPDTLRMPSNGGAIENRVKAYLNTIEPAVSGQNGHGKTIGAVCRIGPGFDLPPNVAKRFIMDHWNPRCEPPWSDAEIDHKIADAYRIETRRGWLLDAPSKNGKAGKARANGIHLHDDSEPKPEIPEIEITTREHEVVDQAVAAISREPNLYQRARALVSVIEDVKPEQKKGIVRPAGTPRIVTQPNAQVRRLMSVHAKWCRAKTDRNGTEMLVDAHIPAWLVEIVATMGRWDGIRPLMGITEIPTLRPDGSLITKPGYDPETGLLYRPSIEFNAVPEKPTRDDVEFAVDNLLAIVDDFPFHTFDSDRGPWMSSSAWLAALLTPMARFAIDGPTPLFLIDANVAGAGKTKLVDIIAILMTGREMARGSYTTDDTEMQKTLLSIVLGGDQLVLFDNVPGGGHIGGPALDRFLTARTMNGRILGRSEMSGEIEVNAVLYATGNNLGLKGDSLRRIVPIVLQSSEERPEERKGFKIQGDLLSHVKHRRSKLVAAAITILRGYIEAGSPNQDLTPMDYPAWSGLIRNAVNWATGSDPCEGRRALIANDDTRIRNTALLIEWENLLGHANMTAMTAAEALRYVQINAESLRSLHDLLMVWSKDGKTLPGSQKLGNELAKIRERNFGGKALWKGKMTGDNAWYVKTIPK